MPRVTLVLPVFNGANFIRRAVQSVKEQTYRDLHLVIVDDGSRDASIHELAEQLGITLILGPHRGAAAARNRALVRGDSEFIGFMDADDYSFPHRIAAQVAEMERGKLDLVASELRFVDENGLPLPGSWKRPAHAEREPWGSLLERNWIGTPGVLLRRTLLKDIGYFDEEFTHAEDYDLWLRAGRAHRIGYVDEPLVLCRRHIGNTSRNFAAHQHFERRALQKVPAAEALAAFRRLYSRPSEQEEAWIWFLLRSGHPGLQAALEGALARNPGSVVLRFALGIRLNDAGALDDACSVFTEIRDVDAAARNNAAVLEVACGKKDSAKEQLERALENHPEYYDAKHNLRALAGNQPLRLTRRPFRADLVPVR